VRFERLVLDEVLDDVRTTAGLLIALEAPVLDVLIAALALALGGAEGHRLTTWFVSRVEKVQDSNYERL
jgi:hypothetical protein